MDGFGNPAADSRPKKKLVRPRHTLLSESARKRRLAQREAARTKVIRISEQQTRWDALKQALGLRTNACVAKVLLDYYETSTLIPIHHVTISTPSLATSRVCSEAEPLAGPSEVRWSTPATKGTEPDVIHTPGQSETSGSAAGSERATSRVWSEAEPLAGPSEVRWSTPATKGTGHEVMHTPGLSEISGSAAGSESDCQLSGIERFPVTDSQSEEQISPKQGGTESLTETRAARASKGPSDSFLDPFNVTFEVTLQSETEEVRMNDDDDDDPDYEPSFCLEAIL